AFMRRISLNVCCTFPVNPAVHPGNHLKVFPTLLQGVNTTLALLGQRGFMYNVIFQSITSKLVPQPIEEITKVTNCVKCSEIKSFTIFVSFTTLLTVSPLDVSS